MGVQISARGEKGGAVVGDAGAGDRPPALTLLAATLSITLGALPVFLVGALAVFVRDELGFGEARLGAAASLYYLSSALASIPGGHLAERLGGRRATGVAATGTLVATAGIALVADDWATLVVFLVVSGLANGLALPASNHLLARGIPLRRQGAAFGLKQSSGPFATLLAGASVPLLGLTVGWRWAFVLAGFAAIPIILFGRPRRTDPHIARRRAAGDVPTGPLVILAVAGASSVVAGSALGAFYVESAVAAGFSAAAAGTMLAVGSMLGILTRLGWGWVGDLYPEIHFRLLAAILALGSVGFVLLGRVDGLLMLALVTVLVFTTGWAWPGLFFFALVRRTPEAPGLATGITGTGVFAGGILGPLVFGTVVERTSYEVAWLIAGTAVFVSAVLMLVGGSRLGAARPSDGAPEAMVAANPGPT